MSEPLKTRYMYPRHGQPPVDRLWVGRTLALLAELLQPGMGEVDNFENEEAQLREKIAGSCIRLARDLLLDMDGPWTAMGLGVLIARLNESGLLDQAIDMKKKIGDEMGGADAAE